MATRLLDERFILDLIEAEPLMQELKEPRRCDCGCMKIPRIIGSEALTFHCPECDPAWGVATPE